MKSASSLKYVPALDGLRGVAITSVAFYHSTSWMRGGWAGVDIFFVLSGYLITRILCDEITKRGRISFGNFYAKRMLRLMPAFAALLLFSLGVLPFVPKEVMPDVRPILVSGVYLTNWSKAFHWLPDSFLDHTWSLAIEEQFYIVWPVCLLLVLPTKRPVVWVLGGAALVLAWRTYLVISGHDDARTYHAFDVRCDGLLIGCALAMMNFSERVREIATKYALVPCFAMAAVLLGLSPRYDLVQSIGLTVVSLIAGCLLVATLQPGPLNILLSLRPLTYTGRISYGWYLWHWPILVIGRACLTPFPGEGIALVAVAYIVAIVSYHFWETPFLRLRARFEPRTPSSSAPLGSTPTNQNSLQAPRDVNVLRTSEVTRI